MPKPDPLTPAGRAMRSRLASHVSWANTDDPTARTAPARAAFMDRFDVEVPAEITDPADRARRAGHNRSAYFTKLALASAKARRVAGEQ